MGNARGGHHRYEIFEDVDTILREREPHRGVGPDEFSILKEVGATVWGSTEDLGPVVEPVLSEGVQLLR